MFPCECGVVLQTGEDFSDHVHRVGDVVACKRKPVDWKPTQSWFDRRTPFPSSPNVDDVG